VVPDVDDDNGDSNGGGDDDLQDEAIPEDGVRYFPKVETAGEMARLIEALLAETTDEANDRATPLSSSAPIQKSTITDLMEPKEEAIASGGPQDSGNWWDNKYWMGEPVWSDDRSGPSYQEGHGDGANEDADEWRI
jgi:hypothetical protein